MPATRKRRRSHSGERSEPIIIDAATAELWISRSSTAAIAVRTLEDATGKPICEGGMAEYVVSEAHRRAALEEKPRAAETPSAILALAAFPASHRGSGNLADCCSVCLDRGGSADTEETLTLKCNHKFHKRCLLGWFAVNAVCPCCRMQAVRLEPYRYPARTALRRKFLSERLNYVVDWRQVPGKPVGLFDLCPARLFLIYPQMPRCPAAPR